MKAKELVSGDWFFWKGDWRIFSRLSGEVKIIDGQKCIPAKPLQPTINVRGGYIPANDEVSVFKEKSFRLN